MHSQSRLKCHGDIARPIGRQASVVKETPAHGITRTSTRTAKINEEAAGLIAEEVAAVEADETAVMLHHVTDATAAMPHRVATAQPTDAAPRTEEVRPTEEAHRTEAAPRTEEVRHIEGAHRTEAAHRVIPIATVHRDQDMGTDTEIGAAHQVAAPHEQDHHQDGQDLNHRVPEIVSNHLPETTRITPAKHS